ncbi:thermonuclease family protein [archaeon]|nr:thermonuclease family protein [archaeon]
MKINYALIMAILLIGVVFISGCTQTGQITSPSRTPPCAPNWQCTGWSECSSFGKQTRTCIDQNNCEATISKPTESQSCTRQIIEPSGQETTLNKSTAFASRVIDGDSIELSNNIEVRLLGINTPERGQPYYQESTDRLKKLVEGKNVVLEDDIEDKDQYGRLLRYVFIDNLFVNLQLVKEGYATVYILQPNTKYETSLRNAENEAKTLKLNIWKQPTGENICDNRCVGISYFKWNAEGNDCDNLNGEYVKFVNTCSYSCDLTSWTVKDESSRNPYVFPIFVLESGKTVTLYTGCGTDTKTQFYWCSSGYSCNAIWNNDGDTLYLRNSNGELVLNYPYTGFS